MTRNSSSSGTGCSELRSLSRRSLIQIGAWSGLSGVAGLGMPRPLHAAQNSVIDPAAGFGKAKRCIFLFMWGGPSHIDTWDPKPHAPDEIRGEFKPIATNVPGIDVTELLPNLSQRADKLAIIRSLNHTDPAHLSSVHHILTGHKAPKVNSDADPPSRKDTPHIGSVLGKLQPTTNGMPPFVSLPWTVMHPSAPGGQAPGQNGGFLGAGYDPFLIEGDPNDEKFQVSGLRLPEQVTLDRFSARRNLLRQIEGEESSPFQNGYAGLLDSAMDLIDSPAIREAFDLNREPSASRERYGRHIHGQCVLMARRLIEAGSSFVCVNWHQDHKNFWDTHGNNFKRLRNDLAPPADKAFSALLDDLGQRGLLDETLVVWVGEFGRRPQISKEHAGRDHWPFCYSGVLAGGGIRGGEIYGRSDAQGGYPAENPVSPADLAATVYHSLGVSDETVIYDPQNRPNRLTAGSPLTSLFG
ncbi:MAG: DUF1501 domain-containing protein [Planctomycetaceae bacterium]|nr:DUF1501 domain-containing protein [Planctomycetaceae bacterium]